MENANVVRTLRDIPTMALELIPKFSGKESKLPIYIRSCDNFLSNYANRENGEVPINKQLFRLMQSRLEDRALELFQLERSPAFGKR